MKPVLITLILNIAVAATVRAQFFVQKLGQDQLTYSQEIYIVTQEQDTLRGTLGGTTYIDGTISKLTLRQPGGEKIKLSLKDIQVLAVVPGEEAQYDDMALLPVLKELKNEDFLKVLPEGGWVFFERIQLPGKQERFILSQVVNPGFDSKIKVFVNPDAGDTGSSSLNGLTLGGARDDSHYVSVAGGRPFLIGSFRYKKKALEKIYNNCAELKSQKLVWKDFAQHVFIYDQKCNQ